MSNGIDQPDVEGMVSDPDFAKLGPGDQRKALTGLTKDNSFMKLNDSDTAQFIKSLARAPESQFVAQRPGQVHPQPIPPIAPAPSQGSMAMVGEGAEAEARGRQQIGQEYMTAGPGEVVRGARDIGQGNIARGGHRMISGAGVTAIPAVAATLPTTLAGAGEAALGLGVGAGVSWGTEKAATKLGATPDQSKLAADIAGLLSGPLSAKIPKVTKSTLQSLARSLTSTTPERLAALAEVEGKVEAMHTLTTATEDQAHKAASAAFPEIKTPVKVNKQIDVQSIPQSVQEWEAAGRPALGKQTVEAEIPMREAQKQYSDLALQIKEARIARSKGLATGFDVEALVKEQADLGQRMQDAAKTDGVAQLRQFLKAKRGFKTFMDDFHNQGSPISQLLRMKPDETAKIAGHFLNPDKGARAMEVLKKYGADISEIEEFLKPGATNVKVDINEAAKLRKLGDQYPELRLNESIDQAKFNRLQSSAQARLPAWAMRPKTKIPFLPEAVSPDVPTRALIRMLLERPFVREGMKP